MHKPKHHKCPELLELVECIRSYKLKRIQAILTANPEFLEDIVVEKENMLHVAMKAKNPTKIVDLLLDNIVKIKGLQEQDNDGYTPFDLAVKLGNLHIMHALCGHGYDCTKVSPQVILPYNKSLLCALGEASNPVDQIETLIKTGLSSDATVIKAQDIIESGNHLRFETFAAKNLKGKKEVNNVLLMYAATQCAVEYKRQDHLSTMYMVKILLQMGADPNAKDEDGLDGLKIAATYGIPELCKLFLEKGANPFTEAQGGGTALSFARNHMVFMGKPHTNVDYPATVEILKDAVYERISILRSAIDHRFVQSTAVAAVVTMFNTRISLPKEILALLAELIIK